MKDHLLCIKDLHAGYGDADVLHGVSLEVSPQEIVGIVGPNGAGKSTVLNAIMSLLQIRGGDIFFKGKSLIGESTERMMAIGISYVPQVSNVFPSLSVYENLIVGAPQRIHLGARIEEILRLFPVLRPRLKMRSGALSGGERQMLAFARGIMSSPSLLLLDEPSAALSPMLAFTVFQKIMEIHETGATMIVVEQNVQRVLQISHKGYVLDSGRNTLVGTGKELLENPEMGQLYLGASFRKDS
jgi:neutral amino acid transport system ATP-binding protein